MNKATSILLLVSLSFSALAQINVDSLWNVWNDQSFADSSRLKAIDDLTFRHYLLVDLDSAQIIAELMLELATSKSLRKYEADAIHNMGAIAGNRGNIAESLEFGHRSLGIRKEIGDKKGMGRSLANIGSTLHSTGDLAKALNYLDQALELFREIGDNDLVSHVLLTKAAIYAQRDDYPSAIEYLSQSIEALKGTGNGYFLSNTLVTLSTMYAKIDDLELAKTYAEQARNVARDYNYRVGESNALGVLGQIHITSTNYDAALACFEEALLLNEKSDNIFTTIQAYSNLAHVFTLKGDYDQAMENSEKSLELARSADKKISVTDGTIIIGLIYTLKNEFEKAIKWCEEGHEMAKELKSITSQKEACECLYKAHKALNNGNEALKYHELMLELNDGLKKEESIKKLNKMEFQKQVLRDSIATAEKERLMQVAHKEEIQKKTRTRNVLIGSGFILLLLAGGFYSRWRYVRRSRDIISKEKDRSDNLLLNILPAEIAQELKEKGEAAARDFEMVSILFTDFKEFTQVSEKLSAAELVNEINACFKAFDTICGKYKVEKIKTIGDAYMAAGGLPIPTDDSVKNTVLAALEMQDFISKRKLEKTKLGEPAFEMRIGIHTGPVVAGIVGVKKFQYDIWGDTVNTASRVESEGEVRKVNISPSTYELIKNDPLFSFESRGKITAKGKGEIEMYFVTLAA
jgi:class 3 adenylate cyclase/Tfp pilus assembly protein PilF